MFNTWASDFSAAGTGGWAAWGTTHRYKVSLGMILRTLDLVVIMGPELKPNTKNGNYI